MKVQKLIEILKELPQDKEVTYVYRYGDRWNTIVALEVDVVEERVLKYSNYHRALKLIEKDEEEENDKSYVVLGGLNLF